MESILYSIPSHTLEGIHEYFEFSIGDQLREVAVDEAPRLKKFLSKVEGKNFPFSYLRV